MKHLLFFALTVLTVHLSFAQQQNAQPPVAENLSLQERYQLLKSKSSNYKEYKVIKETVLDGFWKIVRDSVAAKNAALATRQSNIEKLKADLAVNSTKLAEKEQSMAQIVEDSTHIRVLGINFSKGVFLMIATLVIASLVLLFGLITVRLNSVRGSLKERADAFNTLTTEFDEYKRKAMEKQTKLSRELQTERNRSTEGRGL